MRRQDIVTFFAAQGKDISIIGPLKSIKQPIIDISKSLSRHACLKFFRIREDYVVASSKKNGRELATRPGDEYAFGIHLLFDFTYKTMSFYEINSPQKGFGGLMVAYTLDSLPTDWRPAVVMDFSHGFWQRMKQKHNRIEIL